VNRGADFGNPFGKGAVGFGDRPQVVAAGEEVLVVARFEDQVGGVGSAALVDRDEATGENPAGSLQPCLLDRQVVAGRPQLGGELGRAFATFDEQAAELFLVRLRLCRFAFGARQFRRRRLQLRRERARLIAGPGQLRFQVAGLGGGGRSVKSVGIAHGGRCPYADA
jgi:hypothetical protein